MGICLYVSRILSSLSLGGYLSGIVITDNLLRLSRKSGTVLHAGKDLAVSPHLLLDELFPVGNSLTFVADVSARTSGAAPKAPLRRVLPATRLHLQKRKWACPDFPPRYEIKY